MNAVRGNEEYVHLKSLEDEFHYCESTMPPKEGAQQQAPPPSQQPPEQGGGEEGEEMQDGGMDGGGSYVYDGQEYYPAPFTAEELAAAEAAAAAVNGGAGGQENAGYVHHFMDPLNISEIDRELAQEATSASPFQSYQHPREEEFDAPAPPSMKQRSKSNVRSPYRILVSPLIIRCLL